MKDDLNELEKELQSFQPAPVSPDLRDRVARDLEVARDVQPARHFGRHRLRTVTWLAAAAIVLLALGLAWVQKYRNRSDQGPGLKRAPEIAVQDWQLEDIQTPPRPTRWAYQLAAAESPERLDALLDQHAAVLLPPTPSLDLAGVLAP